MLADFLDRLLALHADPHALPAGAMAARTVVVFFAALLMMRLSGQRTFGGGTSFDMVVKIMLGAVLSRAIAGASPFGPTLLAGLVMALLHRLLAWLTCRSDWVGRLLKGRTYVLVEHGQLRREVLRAQNLSEKDLLQGLRENGHLSSWEQAEQVTLERDGKISVVKKQDQNDC